MGTGAKAVANAGSDTVYGFVTIGGLVTDAANPFTFEVTAQDRANGYAASNLIARGSTELLFGIATGGAASALGKGGKVAQLAGRGLAALDAGGNAYQATSGARDAYQNGLGFQNGAQMIGGALGFAGNVAGAARKAANTKALDEVAQEGAAFAKPRVVDRSWKDKIDGTAHATGTPGHKFRTYKEAIKAAKDPSVSKVHLNHGYNRALGLDPKTISPNRCPDVTILYNDGRVGRIEVKSLSDKVEDLINRNTALDPQIEAQGFDPLWPEVVIPTTSS